MDSRLAVDYHGGEMIASVAIASWRFDGSHSVTAVQTTDSKGYSILLFPLD